MSAWHRRSRVTRPQDGYPRGPLGGAMLRHHWRCTRWFVLIGPVGAYRYRLWLGSRVIGTRALMRADRAKRESEARLLRYRQLHYLDNAIYGYDTRDMQ